MTAPTRRELQRAVTRWCAEYGQDPAEVLVQVQDGGWRGLEALARLVGEEIAARPARAIGPEADVRRSRDPFPDAAAYRRLESIARGEIPHDRLRRGEFVIDARPATGGRQPTWRARLAYTLAAITVAALFSGGFIALFMVP